jgi:hypothetical protein
MHPNGGRRGENEEKMVRKENERKAKIMSYN